MIPPDLQVDHLVLLVGGNPLPNAVGARLLLRTAGKRRITLVYSKATKDVKDRLVKWLRKQTIASTPSAIDIVPLEVKEADPESIISVVRAALDPEEDTGLHYTGGTKAMSVHAYREVERTFRDSIKRPIFSYLDARSLHLIFGPTLDGNVTRIDVRRKIDISLTDMLDLHDWKINTERRYEQRQEVTCESLRKAPLFLPVASALARLCAVDPEPANRETVGGASLWAEWKSFELKDLMSISSRRDADVALGKRGLKLPNVEELQASLAHRIQEQKPGTHAHCRLEAVQALLLTNRDLVDEIANLLRQVLGLSASETRINLGEFCAGSDFPSASEFCQWLDGTWLESHALAELRACNLANRFGRSVMGVKVGSKPSVNKFELDVVAVQGYQLFLLSCSTALDRKVLKLKMFEALTRARQIGGEEARVALVSCYEDPDDLEEEVRFALSPLGRVKVFGRRDLVGLRDRLDDWIREIEQEQGVP